jgi:hypothetical protein
MSATPHSGPWKARSRAPVASASRASTRSGSGFRGDSRRRRCRQSRDEHDGKHAGGLIRGASNVGDDLGAGARGTLLGVLPGAKDFTSETADAIASAAGSVVGATANVGGDLGMGRQGRC